jgi:drug/metabolite transporter (DMT)-like permease
MLSPKRLKHSPAMIKLGLLDHAKDDRPLLAIALLLVATFSLGFQDALMKLMSSDTSFWQIQTLRSVGNLCLVLLLSVLGGSVGLILPRNWKGVYLRAMFLAVCMFFFFSGAPFLSVAQMAAGLYTYPLFVCLMAGPILGETIGSWRIASMVIGATGAALVLSPWAEGFSAVQILPVIAGFFFACNIMTLRRACRHESTLALAFAAALVFLTSGLIGVTLLSVFPPAPELQESMPYVAIGWPTLTVLVAGFAILASLLNLIGNICMTRAYQTADASLLAPLDFSYLIFAAIWGKVIFNRWPEATTLAGMALILCAGIVIAWREQRNNKQRAEHV